MLRSIFGAIQKNAFRLTAIVTLVDEICQLTKVILSASGARATIGSNRI
jgi:hypothetical protein